ncbi:MAG: AEC family transporter [Hyphomicrobiaceae bacterium]
MFDHLVNAVGPVLLCVMVGCGLAKFRAPFDRKVIGSLVANVGYPTLILSHLAGQHISLAEFLVFMFAAACVVLCFLTIGFVFLKIVRLPPRAYLSPLSFGNVGNIGLSISLLTFGPKGLSYAIAFLIVVMLGIFTIGVWLPQGRVSFGKLAREPVIYAIVLAIALLATETHLPPLIDHAFGILGGLAIPLMLLTLGYTLTTLELGDIWRGSLLAVFHLGLAIAVAFALVQIFEFTGTARGVFILSCIMPSAVSTYLWVDRYDPQHAPAVASLIFVSTVLSAVALPVVLSVWI